MSARPLPRLLALWFLAPLLFGARCAESFDLGVGAFEIGQRHALLWTHVVPAPGSGPVQLRVDVALDPGFAAIVRRQGGVAHPLDDFTSRVRVGGLDPGTRYYYRFASGGSVSPTGTFVTAPPESGSDPVRFVVSGDSNLGFTDPLGLDFYVMSAAANESPLPDFFVYFGDTVYADSGILPGGADAFTLDEYRQVHRMTRADPHLQTLLASMGTFSGWDDHEVRNDYDGETVDPVQAQNGYRAFFEYLPLRKVPRNAPYRTDRSVRWGQHLELFFLDGRQFRSEEKFCNPDPIPDGPETPSTLFSPFVTDELILQAILGPLFPAAADVVLPSDPACVAGILNDPSRTILGAAQLSELKQAMLDSTATFKVIVNNTPISDILFLPYDRWEGYGAERADLIGFLGSNFAPGEVVILSTDFHMNLAIQRPEFTEVVVGPIGQSTFGLTVLSLAPPPLQDPALVFPLIDALFDAANGPGSNRGSGYDAFSYAVVDVFEDAGGVPRLEITARGDPDYLSGDNDPAKVVDLFSLSLP